MKNMTSENWKKKKEKYPIMAYCLIFPERARCFLTAFKHPSFSKGNVRWGKGRPHSPESNSQWVIRAYHELASSTNRYMRRVVCPASPGHKMDTEMMSMRSFKLLPLIESILHIQLGWQRGAGKHPAPSSVGTVTLGKGAADQLGNAVHRLSSLVGQLCSTYAVPLSRWWGTQGQG